jgi:hypothetical protein
MRARFFRGFYSVSCKKLLKALRSFCRVAIFAIDWFAFGRLEWYLARFVAFTACSVMHLAWPGSSVVEISCQIYHLTYIFSIFVLALLGGYGLGRR